MDTNSAPALPLTSAPGFTAGRPPEWDLDIFMHGDEIQTALITLERNRLAAVRRLAGLGG